MRRPNFRMQDKMFTLNTVAIGKFIAIVAATVKAALSVGTYLITITSRFFTLINVCEKTTSIEM